MENKPLQECLMTGKSTFYPTPPVSSASLPELTIIAIVCIQEYYMHTQAQMFVKCMCVPPFYQLSILVFLLYFLSHLYLFIINIGILLI